MSFQVLERRISRSLSKNKATLADLHLQLEALPASSVLRARLIAARERVGAEVKRLEAELAEVSALVAKSPELPLEAPRERKR